ncbi:MAG: hypothetical protein V1818_04500 [Candidatus Aenigmatarchaeota archaeon]
MKGQAEVIVFILLFLIGISLFASATIWGRKIFEDNMDFTKLEAAEKIMIDIDNGVSNVIKFGGIKEIAYPLDGTVEIVDTKTIEIRTPLKIEIQEEWINISEGNSYIREKKDGDDLVLQLIYPDGDYIVEFFTDGSSLDSPNYIKLEKNETFTNPTSRIKIKITFM